MGPGLRENEMTSYTTPTPSKTQPTAQAPSDWDDAQAIEPDDLIEFDFVDTGGFDFD